MKLHVTYPQGFLSSYIIREAIARGDQLVEPEDAESIILSGWRYSDPAQSLIDALELLTLVDRNAFVITVGSHAELWGRPPLRWKAYASGKRLLHTATNSAWTSGRILHCRLTQLIGPGMTRGKLALDAAAVIAGKAEYVQLNGSGKSLIAPTDVGFIGALLREIASASRTDPPPSSVINLWSDAPMSISNWLDRWGIPWSRGAMLDEPDIAQGDFPDDVGNVTRDLLTYVLFRHPENQEIV